MTTALLHSPAFIIRQLIIDLNLGTNGGVWPVYAAKEPSSPDNCITVYNTTGKSDGRNNPTHEAMQHQGFQARVRSVDHPIGYARMEAIRHAMTEQVLNTITVVANGYPYLIPCISRISSVIDLGEESPTSSRKLFVVNAMVVIRPLY